MIDLSDNNEVKQLVKGCINGDRKASKQFFKIFYGKMMSICMRYAEDKDEAQDFVQEAFIKVFEKLKEFEFKGSIDGWVKKIVTNLALDMVRKRNTLEVPLEENRNYENFADDYDENIEIEMINKMKVEVIIELIQKLTPMYRTVFNLYIFEDLSHKEIAEKLNINIGTSKSNFAKARKNLLSLLEEHNNGNGK